MNLNGRNGIVYLGFLGQETYARVIAQQLIRTELIRDENTIYTIIKKLHNAGFIIDLGRIESNPGVPVVRTASFTPFFSLLNVVKSNLSEEDFSRMTEYIYGIGKASLYFPDYLRMVNDLSKKKISKLKWPELVATYLNFIMGLLIFVNPDEVFDSKAYSTITNEDYEEKVTEKHFNPMRNALSQVPDEFSENIVKKHYRDDIELLAELSTLIAFGPKYNWAKKNIGYAARKRLAEYYLNEKK